MTDVFVNIREKKNSFVSFRLLVLSPFSSFNSATFIYMQKEEEKRAEEIKRRKKDGIYAHITLMN